MVMILNCSKCRQPISISTTPAYENELPVHSKCLGLKPSEQSVSVGRTPTYSPTCGTSIYGSMPLDIEHITFAQSKWVFELFHKNLPRSSGSLLDSKMTIDEFYTVLENWYYKTDMKGSRFKLPVLRFYTASFNPSERLELEVILSRWDRVLNKQVKDEQI